MKGSGHYCNICGADANKINGKGWRCFKHKTEAKK
jgi:hypothetical protein